VARPRPRLRWRDRLLLTLLRPHLIVAFRTAERGRQAPAALTHASSNYCNTSPKATSTQRSSSGCSCPEGTVRTHPNHIYERLGVTSRTAAVTRMSTAGLE